VRVLRITEKKINNTSRVWKNMAFAKGKRGFVEIKN
jgi:hypothetical protein